MCAGTWKRKNWRLLIKKGIPKKFKQVFFYLLGLKKNKPTLHTGELSGAGSVAVAVGVDDR